MGHFYGEPSAICSIPQSSPSFWISRSSTGTSLWHSYCFPTHNITMFNYSGLPMVYGRYNYGYWGVVMFFYKNLQYITVEDEYHKFRSFVPLSMAMSTLRRLWEALFGTFTSDPATELHGNEFEAEKKFGILGHPQLSTLRVWFPRGLLSSGFVKQSQGLSGTIKATKLRHLRHQSPR